MDEEEERRITMTARWHLRANSLEREVADVLAHKHAGFTHEAIARELDTTSSTVEKRLNRVVAVYGPEAS